MPTEMWTIKSVLEVSDGTRTLVGMELETIHVTVSRLSGPFNNVVTGKTPATLEAELNAFLNYQMPMNLWWSVVPCNGLNWNVFNRLIFYMLRIQL